MKVLIVSLLMVISGLVAKQGHADQQPNIVFLFADDYGKYASVDAEHEPEPTVNSVISTPNIDQR